MQQVNITLGTAGHIDHGKTALVKLLTGCETDRLKEEKERGMSIDLGYAPCTVAGLEIGIVDVPGHENFIKTMVAGASGMDGVILVVAADDGIMPQTREHLDILTLLGLRHGLVALTKIDRVSSEHLEQVQADLAGFLQGTFLEAAPILPISNITGQGLDLFLETLETLVKGIRPKRIDGVFRLPLDRAFSAKGFGTVVAGIPTAGSASLGDELVLLPQNVTGRVKRIEVYGRTSDTVMAGQCAAINLGHCDAREIARGNVLTLPDYFEPNEWYICLFRLLPREKAALKNGSEVKFHTGTSEVNANIYFLDKAELGAGSEHFIQIRTKRPVVAGPGDHFILRTFSPIQTIGGGKILEAVGRRLKRNRPGLVEDLQGMAAALEDETQFVEYAVRKAETLTVSETELARQTKILRPRLREILTALIRTQKVLVLGVGLYMHRQTADDAGQKLIDMLAEFHSQSPESPGISFEQLRLACRWEKPVVDAIFALLKSAGRIVEQNERLALAGHRATFKDQDALYLEQIESVFRQQLFAPPNMQELAEKTAINQATLERLMRTLQEHGRLVSVGEGLIFHCEAIEQARALLVDHIQKEGKLESVRFKYLLNTTRKFALPLLDYFDRIGLLRRVGNTRYLKAKTN